MNNMEQTPERSATAITALLLPSAVEISSSSTADQCSTEHKLKVKSDRKQAKDGNIHGGASADAVCDNDRKTDTVHEPLNTVMEHWDLPVIEPLDLLEKIADKENLLLAIRITASQPDKCPGTDGKYVTEVCDKLLRNHNEEGVDALQQMILEGSYVPGNIRRVEIPKRNKKGKRPLGIGNVTDRIVQRAVLNVLNDYLPIDAWNEHSYAYHKGQEVRDALIDADNARQKGYRYVISVDLQAFFDNVPQERLIRKLRYHIRDVRVVELLISFIKAEIVLPNGTLLKNDVIGTPQGNALSPYLASDVYLDELDKELTRRNHRFVRYADDCVIFCKSLQAAVRTKRRIQAFLTDVMCCPVNENKTEIKSTDSMKYLGVYRKGNAWHPEEDRIRDLKAKVREQLAFAEALKDPMLTLKAKASLDGFINYYERINGIDRAAVMALKEWKNTLFPTISKHRTAPAMSRHTCSQQTHMTTEI